MTRALALVALWPALAFASEPTDLCLDEPPAWLAALRTGKVSGREETGEIWRGGYGASRVEALANLLVVLADRRLPGEAAAEAEPDAKGRKRGTSKSTTFRNSLLARTGEVLVHVDAKVDEIDESTKAGPHKRTVVTVTARYGEAKKPVELRTVRDESTTGVVREATATEGPGASVAELVAVLRTRLPNKVEEWPGCGEEGLRVLFRGLRKDDDEAP